MKHRPIHHAAQHLGHTDHTEVIEVTIELRRKPDHHPIPSFDDYVGCPARPILTNDEFADRYGASSTDIDDIDQHYQTHGLAVVDQHMARRHVTLRGTVSQFNSAFGVTLRNYRKPHGSQMVDYRHHPEPVHIPHHLAHVVVNVLDLHTEPLVKPHAANPAVTPFLSLSQIMSIYEVPANSAAGQTIGIAYFAGFGKWLQTDIALTCGSYSLPTPSITTVVMNALTGETVFNEISLDVNMCAIFGSGANLVIFEGPSDPAAFYARAAHPNVGEPQCTVLSLSGGFDENFADLTDLSLQDCAIKGITVVASSGDTAQLSSVGDIIVSEYPASHPYVTAIGGTVLGANSGTVSNTNFVEWAWDEAVYFGQTGGGVSVEYARPSYQTGFTFPATLTTLTGSLNGAVGRASPDIAAVASASSGPIYANNGLNWTDGGTSKACPMMAGILARINAAVGRNIGFINPTLYRSSTNFIRKLNTGGSTRVDGVSSLNHTITGYPVTTTGWNAAVGLGMLRGTSFLNFLRLPKNYFVFVQGVTTIDGGSTGALTNPVQLTIDV